MPTTTQLADRVCQITGLQSTGVERALVLQALNNAYQRGVEETEAYSGSATATLTAGTSDYELSAAPFSRTDILRIKHLVVSGSGASAIRAERVNEGYLLSLREGGAPTGAAYYYATGGVNTIRFWPEPSSGVTVSLYYVKAPPELVEAAPTVGQESTPSVLPARFHWDVIAAGAVVEALDKDQRAEDAAFWLQRHQEGILSLRRFVNEFGGDSAAMILPDQMGRVLESDQRTRYGS